jgi:hypothetical protein
LSEIID